MARKKRVVKTVIVRAQPNQRRKSVPRNRRRNRRRVPRMAAGKQLTAQYIQSLADPWSQSSCIPDGANGVGCFSTKETILLGTGAAGGSCGYIFNPNSVVNNNKLDTLSTAVTPTFAGNYASTTAVASIVALYSDTRVVSAGIKARYVSNTQTDQGILLIGQVSGNVSPNSFNGTTLTQAQALMQNYKVFPLRSGGSVMWRPQCMDDASAYTITTGSVTALTQAPLSPYLIVLVYGGTAATSSLVILDVVCNYEGQYRQQTFLPGGVDATPVKAEPGWYESALNAVRQFEPILPFVQSTMVNAMNSPAAATAMGSLFGSASRRGLPRLANYMQVD